MKRMFLVAACCLLTTITVFTQPKITSFIDTSNMDRSVKPGDDFYRYANDNWLKNNPVPSSKTRWSNFNVLADEASNLMKSLLDEAAANPGKNRLSQMTGDFYASAMDSMAIEKSGFTPIQA